MRIITTLILLLAVSCTSIPLREQKAPAKFHAKFMTTQGDFIVEFERQLSPLAVDRVFQLIKSKYYTDIAIYRVVPNFVAQFGISNDSLLNVAWKDGVEDEPVKGKNTMGTLSFARGGQKTRNTQLFINLKSNSPRLDELEYSGVKGFPIVGKVIGDGMEVVHKLYKDYGEAPGRLQRDIRLFGNSVLKEKFPKLDYIKEVIIIDSDVVFDMLKLKMKN